MGDELMTAAVELTGITKRFGDVTAVDHVDLAIEDGEFFAMLGPSGCGKTTTLRMIAGLEFPTEGSLKIFGDEVGTLPPNKRPVNTVFQNYALFPHMNVLDNVAFGLRMRKVSKSRHGLVLPRPSASCSSLVSENRKPSQMSGGQRSGWRWRERSSTNPVLLLDEPLGALDLKLRQEMQGELKTLQSELGVSFVFVTHDQEEALTMSDRIAVMHDGKLLQVGTPEEIYERPTSRFVADFIGQTNLLEGTVEDAATVCLANGARVAATSALPAGSAVAVSLRPERAHIGDRGMASRGMASVDGIVDRTTYLGNALVYTVRLDWMEIEVREENRPGAELHAPGTEVTVSWDPHAISVVADS